jgi:hypothetical protein
LPAITAASVRVVVFIVEYGGLSGGCSCGRLGHVAVELLGSTSTDSVGDEDEEEDQGNYADDGEDTSYCRRVLEK